jgi:hypothetical protein
MFRLTTKIKLAAGFAAGALTLGAAGAYAANANNTITVDPTKSFSLSNGTTTLNLVPLNNKSTLTLPTTGFKNAGACQSWFATNRNYALAPAAGSKTVSKNYHGKLMGGVQAFCDKYAPSATKTGSAEIETPDATQSDAASTDSTDASASQGHGHANGRGKHAHGND